MRTKFITTVLLTATIAIAGLFGKASANPVDERKAMTVASNFLGVLSKRPVGELTNITAQTPWHEFYIFNVGSNGGFVIVSGDDCAIPILAYSLSGTFETRNIPANISHWLQNYEQQIAWLRSQSKEGDNSASNASDPDAVLQDWNRLLSSSNDTIPHNTSVGPLLTTKWDQGTGYNDSCPALGASEPRALTGCVATAMAQIMKKWNHPSTGYGSHSYTHSTYGTISANFGATTYNWSAMPDSLTSSSTPTQIDAVATLMYQLGVAVDMNYSDTASGAPINHHFNLARPSAEVALRTYFKYKSSLHQISYDDFSDIEWKNKLKFELQSGRPVLYGGSKDEGNGSHAFVCEGYSEITSLFLFNWGWSGHADGYYAIGSLNPHSTRHYNTRNIAIVGIEPNNSWGESTTVAANTNNSNLGTVSGGGTYSFGDNVSLMAQPSSGMRFDGWTDGYKYNPRQFVANGGNYNFTARFRSIAGDTLSYCIADSYVGGYGSNASYTDYWGVIFPPATLREGQKLRQIQIFARSAGSYTLSIYRNSVYTAALTQNFTVTADEINSWKTITLNTPVSIITSSNLRIKLSSTADHPVSFTYYSGCTNASLYGNSLDPLNSNYHYDWLIKAITSADPCDTVTSFPYTEDFEGACWNYVNGNGANIWTIGSAADATSGSGHSLYVSNDNGASNSYSLDYETPGIMAYKTLQLDVQSYEISFKWEAYGQTNSDYLRAALVPASVDLAAGDTWGHGDLPAGFIPLDGNSQLTQIFPFATRTDTVSISEAGFYNLVFYWTNDDNSGNSMNTAATIDDISIRVVCQQIATIPYHDDFDGDNSCWNFVNGSYTNQWHIGAVGNDPNHFMYISNNGGNSCSYDITSPSIVKAYRTLELEARKYSIKYQYYVRGEHGYDYMRVALVPDTVDLTTPTQWGTGTLPTGYIALDGNEQLCNTGSVQDANIIFTVPSAGTYNLVFYWRNDNIAGNNPPTEVDDIVIDTVAEVICAPLSPVLYYTDFENASDDGEWTILNGSYINRWTIGSAANNTTDGNRALYISNDNGTSNSYTYTSTSMVLAYHTLQLEARHYSIRYDWRAYGQTGADFMRVALVPSTVSLSAGASWTSSSLPSSLYISADDESQRALCDDWTTTAVSVDVPTAGEYNLVFYWRNNNNTGSLPPAAVDNISIGFAEDGFHIEDTISFCGTSEYRGRFGNSSDPIWWGINLSPSQLSGSNYLKSVLLYTTQSGTYTMNIYTGDCNNPNTLVYSKDYAITNSGLYRTLVLDSALAIDHTQHLWVTFKNQDVSYPISYCDYVGTPQSNWFSIDGETWFPYTFANEDSDNQLSWLIKCVTASTVDPACAVADAVAYAENFEDASTEDCWTFINDYDNKWVIGTADNNTANGSHALYVSGGAGTTSVGIASVAIAYRTLQFEVDDYTISFDWKSGSQTNYSFMRVLLVPDDVNVSGVYWDYGSYYLPSGTIPLDGQYPLNQNTTWSTRTTTVSIPAAGRYKLVLYWKNTNSTIYSAAVIDNISITQNNPTTDFAFTAPFTMDFEDPSTNSLAVKYLNGNYTTKWCVGSAANNTAGGSTALYISADNGVTNAIGQNMASSVVAYIPINLEARDYKIKFDYKGVGINDEMLRAALVYDTVPLASIPSVWADDDLLEGYSAIGSVNLLSQNSWTTLSTDIVVPVTGRYKLVFYWYNYNSYNISGIQAAAIDNIVFDTDNVHNISFCGDNAPFTNAHITSSNFSWGIRFTPEQMSRHDFLEGVMLYTDGMAPFGEGSDSVVLNIYSGNSYSPTTLLYSHAYLIDDNTDGYKVRYLDSSVAIDHSKHLWITFHRNHSSYIYASRGWGFEGGNWIGSNDNWQSSEDFYWMIKAIVSNTNTNPNTGCAVVNTLPYVCNFEDADDAACWSLVGTAANRWAIGYATNGNPGGSNALYISSDNGNSNTYDITSASTAIAYRTFHLSQGLYSICFNWKVVGETDYDYLRAALVPGTYPLNPGTAWGSQELPSECMPLDGNSQLGVQTAWQGNCTFVTIADEGDYKLVFYWRNDGNTGSQPPAAIDIVSVYAFTPLAPAVTVSGSSTAQVGVASAYTATVDQEATVTWTVEGATPDTYTGNNVSIIWQTEGVYNVIATATNDNGTSSDTLAVVVSGCEDIVTNYAVTSCDSYTLYGVNYTSSETITQVFTTADGCDSTVVVDLTIYYSTTTYDTVVLGSNELPYQWNGQTINTAGNYNAMLTTSHGCDSSAWLYVVVNQVGMDIVDSENAVRIYPNPTDGIVTVEADGVSTIEVFDMMGVRVLLREKSNKVDMTNLPAGTYTMRITLDYGTVIRKVVRE